MATLKPNKESIKNNNDKLEKKVKEKEGQENFNKLLTAFLAAGALSQTTIANSDIEKLNLKNGQEISVQEMNKKIFLPSPTNKQYIVDPNKVQNVIVLNNSDLAIQTNDKSKNLNLIIQNGIKYIDTNSKSKLEEEFNELLDSYKASNFDMEQDNVNNKRAIDVINKNIVTLEKDVDKITKDLSKLRANYLVENNKVEASREKIVNLTNKLPEDTDRDKINIILQKKAEIFEKREQLFSLTTPLFGQEKKDLEKEIKNLKNEVKTLMNESKLSKDIKTIFYLLDDYDKKIVSLESYNKQIEAKELNLASVFDMIQELNQDKIDLANGSEILDYKKDSDFNEQIKNHIRFSETSSMEGVYNKTKNIKDGAGISFGTYQFTEASGMIKKFLEEYANQTNDKFAINALKQMKLETKVGNDGKNRSSWDFKGNDKELTEFLIKIGNSDVSRQIQDKLYEDNYLKQSYQIIDRNNITDKKAIAHIIDHFLNTGGGGAEEMLARCKGDFSPENIADNRKEHYLAIAKSKDAKDPNSGSQFINGWFNRVDNTDKHFEDFHLKKEIKKVATLDNEMEFDKYYKSIKSNTLSALEKDKSFEIQGV